MKVTTQVTLTDEVDVEITSEDIQVIFSDPSEDTKGIILGQISSIYTFLNGIPEARIKEMTTQNRKVIADFLMGQSNRFNPLTKKQ